MSIWLSILGMRDRSTIGHGGAIVREHVVGGRMNFHKIFAIGALAIASPILSGNCPKKVCNILRSKGLGRYLAPETNITKIGIIKFRRVYCIL